MAATNPILKLFAGLDSAATKAMLDTFRANPALAPHVAEVETFLKEQSESIVKVRKQTQAEMDRAAQEVFLGEVKPALSAVKLDGYRVNLDVKTVTVKTDGTLDNLTVAITSESLAAITALMQADVTKCLKGRKPVKDVQLSITKDGVSIVNEVKLTVPRAKSDKADGDNSGKSRGDKAVLIDGKLYETGAAACKALDIDFGKASAWKVFFANKHEDVLKAHKVIFSGSRKGIEDDLVRAVKNGAVTVQDDLIE